jgi:hypothetical protein
VIKRHQNALFSTAHAGLDLSGVEKWSKAQIIAAVKNNSNFSLSELVFSMNPLINSSHNNEGTLFHCPHCIKSPLGPAMI